MTRAARRVGPISVAALVAGATLVGTALAASASSGPSITVSPDTGLSQGTEVGIDGAGFPKKAPSPGGFMECSTAAGQPTVSVTGFPTPLPVSCSNPASAAAKVGPSGKIAFTGLLIHTGTVGPPQTGADTNGSGDAATDATSFPCPPYPAQVAAGAGCEIVYLDAAGATATQALSFTTATTPTTSTSTTTTTAPCVAQSKTVTATPPNGTATVTVDPDTCLTAGTTVTITATGLLPYAKPANELGTVVECNSDPGQPTVPLAGHNFPVSCTQVLATDFTPNAAGTHSQTFSVVRGITGPPTTGTDSAGKPGSTDAAGYPCPPTPAQTADTCVIAVGDQGGDKVVVPIAFNPNDVGTNSPTSPTSPGVKSSTSPKPITKASTSSTKTSSGSLAFTGPGPGLWWMGLSGVVLMTAGGLLLLVVDEPRRMRRRVVRPPR